MTKQEKIPWHDIAEPVTRDLLIGFYDLTHYTRYCRQHSDRHVLKIMQGYFALTGKIITDDGGLLVKTLGDAGLAAFDGADSDKGVRCFLRLQQVGDRWLSENGVPGGAIIKLHLGPVALGLVGAPGREVLDTYGETVNTAALLESGGFALSSQVFRSLSMETRTLLEKHTPPITRIGRDIPHRSPVEGD